MGQEKQAMNLNVLRAAVIAASVVAGGCGLTSHPQPLDPNQFVRSPRPAVGPDPIGQPVAQSGVIDYGELHPPLVPEEYPNKNPKPSPGVSPLVVRDVPAPGERPKPQPVVAVPATAPAPPPSPGQPTGYQVVGTVVATVNTKPIFADKVLASIERELASEARKYPPQEFRKVAQQDIYQDVRRRIDGQLEIEMATASLSQDAKQQAGLIAQLWRRQQITASGGSEAIARQRALDAGEPLDEQVKDQYNIALVRLYYQQHITPKIHVTASDMRRYYAEHLQTEFSKPAEARYRLIRIDFARSGGPEEAAKKANRIIDDLKGGASFEAEAHKYNDDPLLMQSGGDMGWMQKGSYKFDKVEDAIWALQPGQYTDHPIEVSDPSTGSAFYIGALQERRGGTVQPFESETVQNAINAKLSSQQFNEYRMKVIQRMSERAAVFLEPNGLETAVEMAMQRYPVWASAR
jgi:parvulin-like peptidyl-prolyl isomerase